MIEIIKKERDKIEVSSLLTFKENKVLLVRSRNKWTLPGGKRKINKRESPKDCLVREIKEELPFLKIITFKKFAEFPNEITPHSKKPFKLIVFKGVVKGLILPDSEIKEAKWFSFKELKEYKKRISKSTKKAIRKSGQI